MQDASFAAKKKKKIVTLIYKNIVTPIFSPNYILNIWKIPPI